MLYKYRDFTNLQFALDIIVNQRLFASPFEKLNDPMEGSYLYEVGMLARYQIDAIYGEKNRWHLVSLSEAPDNMLMWSHYASGHSGMVVGIEVTDPDTEITPVTYVDNLRIIENKADIAKLILSRKFDLWKYEGEHRVFKRNEKGKNAKTYVHVEIREVIFGTKTDSMMKELVSSIAKKFCPGIAVRSIKRHELKTGRRVGVDA